LSQPALFRVDPAAYVMANRLRQEVRILFVC
jgi:hypothetical protein